MVAVVSHDFLIEISCLNHAGVTRRLEAAVQRGLHHIMQVLDISFIIFGVRSSLHVRFLELSVDQAGGAYYVMMDSK